MARVLHGFYLMAWMVISHINIMNPPWLEPRGEHEETVRVGGEEITFKVVEVTPSLAAL